MLLKGVLVERRGLILPLKCHFNVFFALIPVVLTGIQYVSEIPNTKENGNAILSINICIYAKFQNKFQLSRKIQYLKYFKSRVFASDSFINLTTKRKLFDINLLTCKHKLASSSALIDTYSGVFGSI